VIRVSRIMSGMLAAALAACASAPLHFYTLVAGPADPVSEPNAPAAGIDISVVHVPPAADRLELVVRRNDSEASILNEELWVAPLTEELHSALWLELRRALRSATATSGPRPRIAIRLDVRRFEGMPGRYALIDASWRLSVSSPTVNRVMECVNHLVEPVGNGYPALVRGYQRAVTALAQNMAAAAREAQADAAHGCVPS